MERWQMENMETIKKISEINDNCYSVNMFDLVS
jgi:hypothetical protein